MTTEEAQKVLDELQGVRPEVLNGEAKKLFEAIMKIADTRDKALDEKSQLLRENTFLKGKVTALKRIKKDLETQRDYYKARYLEFNDAFINSKKEDKQ